MFCEVYTVGMVPAYAVSVVPLIGMQPFSLSLLPCMATAATYLVSQLKLKRNLFVFQFVRVRTVSGITYHCRSGKSFKGQMMDRFLLTDCRAVLSGNYRSAKEKKHDVRFIM